MVIVFDLDDTLYEEMEFVKSGFQEVAHHLQSLFAIDEHKLYNDMLDLLEQKGRGSIFNEILSSHGLLNKNNVKECISIYRSHTPKITLPESTYECFKRFNNYPKYIVTDGHKVVQHNKVKALGLKELVKKVFITHRYGVKNAKPSPYCFFKIQQTEKTTADNVVYIGDNTRKDFIGIKPYGFKTIRVNTGNYKQDWYSEAHEAHIVIDTLDELTIEVISKIRAKQ